MCKEVSRCGSREVTIFLFLLAWVTQNSYNLKVFPWRTTQVRKLYILQRLYNDSWHIRVICKVRRLGAEMPLKEEIGGEIEGDFMNNSIVVKSLVRKMMHIQLTRFWDAGSSWILLTILCSQSGDCPENNLVKFGYIIDMKVEFFLKNPSIFLATFVEVIIRLWQLGIF
jgi:hypothetical protein